MEIINDIKINFASLDDEMAAMDKWMKTPFGKALKSIVKASVEIEGQEMTDYGFMATPIEMEIADYDWGFNGQAKNLAEHLAYYLVNHDWVYIKPNGQACTKQSNYPNVARQLNIIMGMVGTDAKWVRERFYSNI